MIRFERVSRIEEEIKLPTRATSGSAGYDFYAIEDIELPAGELTRIPTGIKCKITPFMALILANRSSNPSKRNLVLSNGIGVIDGTTTKDSIGYNGNDDEWKAPLLSFRDTTIEVGDRICQFRIQLSQKATVWQKIKWALSSGIEFVEVDEVPNKNNRNGLGSSGKH